jgi:hypothetical protein
MHRVERNVFAITKKSASQKVVMVSIRFDCTTQLNDRIAANQFVTFQVLERVARSDLDIFLILIFPVHGFIAYLVLRGFPCRFQVHRGIFANGDRCSSRP